MFLEEPSIIGCPVHVWADEAGLALRVFGANYLDPGTAGSTPFWAIPGELYRRSGDVGVMSTGRFKFNGNDSMIELREECKSTPWWEIDPESGAVVGFVGWGAALFDAPCDWNI